MPPRRKPTSTKQKKVDQQLKRAIKRGDVPPPDPNSKKSSQHRKPKAYRLGPTGQPIGSSSDPASIAAVESAKRLQSAFIKLPPKFLEDSKLLASNLPLPRPLPEASAIFVDPSSTYVNSEKNLFTCPQRPKWRFDMTKTEVERNEEGVYKKWLSYTDELVEKWQNDIGASPQEEGQLPQMPASPTYFERNLEVWRQLWRVTEISQIILVLLDSRCPILHYPPSLSAYLADHKVILVLTKVDITGPGRVQAWTKYFHDRFPQLRVVQVESYIEKEASTEHQGRKQYEPHIPAAFRERLVQAIREAHAELLKPPDKVKNNPTWLAKWSPSVKRDVNWEGVLRAGGAKVGSVVGGPAAPRENLADDSLGSDEHKEPEFLTVGLIGQPNVGKSSLLNALFGARKVRASKTPGKTKHFQTLYWTPDVRLVDCPGLVMPNYIPMEMQVLSGILPISRVSAVPSCIYYASQFLPIEHIYKLAHPSTKLPPVEDKRTWREGMKVGEETGKDKVVQWTAMDVLTAYADAKGWVTAKAGRPDVHRAGNALLRAIAEGKVAWAFWPPGTSLQIASTESGDGLGIWIPRDNVPDNEDEQTDDDEGVDEDEDHINAISEETSEGEDSDMDAGIGENVGIGRFGALVIQNDEEEDSEGEETGESDE